MRLKIKKKIFWGTKFSAVDKVQRILSLPGGSPGYNKIYALDLSDIKVKSIETKISAVDKVQRILSLPGGSPEHFGIPTVFYQ